METRRTRPPYASAADGVSGPSWLGPDICMKSSLSSVMSSSRDGRGGVGRCSRSSMKSHRRTLFMNWRRKTKTQTQTQFINYKSHVHLSCWTTTVSQRAGCGLWPGRFPRSSAVSAAGPVLLGSRLGKREDTNTSLRTDTNRDPDRSTYRPSYCRHTKNNIYHIVYSFCVVFYHFIACIIFYCCLVQLTLF